MLALGFEMDSLVLMFCLTECFFFFFFFLVGGGGCRLVCFIRIEDYFDELNR